MSKTLIRDGVVYYERGFVDDLKSQLKAKEEELNKLRVWLENERDDWGSTNKDRTNPFMRTLSKIGELQKGGEGE